MQKLKQTFDQLLQTLITTLKYQFPLIQSIPITTHYWTDIVSLLSQSHILSARAVNRLGRISVYQADPGMIDSAAVLYLRQLIDYYQDLQETDHQSQLARLFDQLDISSAQTVVNGQAKLTDLQNYLNIPLQAQTVLETILTRLPQTSHTLTLIVGGSGKSQLLAHIQETDQQLLAIPNLVIKDNAGSGEDPQRTVDDQLLDDFAEFSDLQMAQARSFHEIMTIHHDLLKRLAILTHKLGTFKHLGTILSQAHLNDLPVNVMTPEIQVIFIDAQVLYQLTPDGNESTFFDQLMARIFSANTFDNPFYRAFQADTNHSINTALHRNYRIMTQPQVLDSIKYLLIKAQLIHNRNFSIREVLTFLHDIIVPKPTLSSIHNSLFNLLFPIQPQTQILKDLQSCDPMNQNNTALTDMLAAFSRSKDKLIFMQQQLRMYSLPSKWLKDFYEYFVDRNTSKALIAQQFIRILFLFNHDLDFFKDPIYHDYLQSYQQIAQTNFEPKLAVAVNQGIQKWFQSITASSVNTLFHSQIYFMQTYKSMIQIYFSTQNECHEHLWSFELTLNVYHMLRALDDGYVLLPKDQHQVNQFAQFMTKLRQTIRITDLAKTGS